MTSVDLPEPDTPVTAVKTPSGMSTSTPLRLCWEAPSIRTWPLGLRRSAGISIRRVPLRNWPVSDSGTASTSAAVPAATT